MSVSEYIKQAASMLQRAAQARRSEIDDLRRQIQHTEADDGSQINQLRRLQLDRQQAIARAENDEERQRRTQELARLKMDEKLIGDHTKQAKSDLSGAISQMEAEMNDLQRLASDLERRAPSM